MPATGRFPLIISITAGICCLYLICLGTHPKVWAAMLNWRTQPYNHYANKEDIKDVLTDFFATQGVGVMCSENVSGTVSGNFKAEDPRTFFDQLTDAYNLIWYYDGAAVYVYSAHEMTSRVVNLGYLNMERFRQSLVDLEILDPKFAFRMVTKERIVFVAGPERYVELVAHLAEELDAKAMAQRGRDDIVKVFPLKYAWAEDKTILFRDRQMTIRGVATLLRDLITGNTAPGQIDIGDQTRLRTHLSRLKGQGLARTKRPPDDTPAAEHQTSSDTATRPKIPTEPDSDTQTDRTPPSYMDTDQGFVQADARQNAVVVRDREEKMPYYQGIIAMLDVPVGLVEIKATIMDIDRNNLEDLGIEWEFAAQGDDGDQVVKGGLNTTTPHVAADGLHLPVSAGLNLATIVGSATDFFLAKVHALQEDGHAKILSRPSVLTLNNIEAQLEHSKTFYVRVAGNEEVDLFDINTGVVLRVTPHIIDEGEASLVKLSIQIEDGELLDEQVDDIPVVKKSVINTQAVVGEEESLLIGGYFKEKNARTRQTIPCLGSVPLLGWLFTKQATSGEESERLFLITPTIKPYTYGRTTAQRPASSDGLPADHATRSILNPTGPVRR